MKKMLFAIALLLSLSGAAFAQRERCTVTMKDGPVIQGFKLGGSIAEIEKEFPQLKKGLPGKDGEVVSATVAVDEATYLLNFKNDLLTIMLARYKKMDPPDVDAFLEFLKSSINLPDAWWVTPLLKDQKDVSKVSEIDLQIFVLERESGALAKRVGAEDPQIKELNGRMANLKSESERILRANTVLGMGCTGFTLNASIGPDGIPELFVSVNAPQISEPAQ